VPICPLEGSLPRHTLSCQPRSPLKYRPVKSHSQVKNPLGGSMPRYPPTMLPMSQLRSQQAKSNKTTKIQLKLPIKSATRSWRWNLPICWPRFNKSLLFRATIKLTDYLPKWTSIDDNSITVIYQSLLPGSNILQRMQIHCMKTQESANGLTVGKYRHWRETYIIDSNQWNAIDVYDRRLQLMVAAETPIDDISCAKSQTHRWFQQCPLPRFELWW